MTSNIYLDAHLDAAMHDCAECAAPFEANVAALLYPAGDLAAARPICPDCLRSISPDLATVADALNTIATIGSDYILGLTQQTVSRIRQANRDRTIDEGGRLLVGPDAQPPAVIYADHAELADDSDLHLTASVRDGEPWITLSDAGGWEFIDDHADAAVDLAARILDTAESARVASRPRLVPAGPELNGPALHRHPHVGGETP